MYRCILHYVFDLAVILRTIRNFKGWPQFLFGGQSFVVALLLFWFSVASLTAASPPQDVPKPPTIIARPQLAWARFQRNTFRGDFCADRLSWGITSPSSSFWRRNLCSNILMVSPQRFHLIPVELIWFWNVVIVYILWTYLSCPTASPATCGELELRRRNRGREVGHKGKGRRRGRDLKGSQRGGWIGVVIHVSISFQRSPLKIAGEHLSGKKDKIYVRRRGKPTRKSKQPKILILKSQIKPEN